MISRLADVKISNFSSVPRPRTIPPPLGPCGPTDRPVGRTLRELCPRLPTRGAGSSSDPLDHPCQLDLPRAPRAASLRRADGVGVRGPHSRAQPGAMETLPQCRPCRTIRLVLWELQPLL
ncbi:unnamed protein product [Eretmochelys imbricata]